eukprot:15459290-Alexandrium_andersonii.AAC.1
MHCSLIAVPALAPAHCAARAMRARAHCSSRADQFATSGVNFNSGVKLLRVPSQFSPSVPAVRAGAAP